MTIYKEEELLEVMSERVRKYTSNESSSISYNKAKQIMSSILYCMEEVTEKKENMDSQYSLLTMKELHAREVFQLGLDLKKKKISQALDQYNQLKETFCYYENDCYRDTVIGGLEGFFKIYDVEFDATNHILTLDYPLMNEITCLQGIDLISEYIRRTVLEQRFLSIFEEKEIRNVLSGYSGKQSECVFNISKIVLRNTIGCMLVHKPIEELSLNLLCREEIQRKYELCKKEELKQKIEKLIKQLVKETFGEDDMLFIYLEQNVEEIAFELHHCLKNHCLEQLFLEEKAKITETKVFEDGIVMEDEDLRNLIDKMNQKDSLEERIALLKEKVRSIEDLKEVLPVCFYDEECEKVFELLSQEEIEFLKEDIMQKIDFDEELLEWEKVLMKVDNPV